jgi:hypothetical protein
MQGGLGSLRALMRRSLLARVYHQALNVYSLMVWFAAQPQLL